MWVRRRIMRGQTLEVGLLERRVNSPRTDPIRTGFDLEGALAEMRVNRRRRSQNDVR